MLTVSQQPQAHTAPSEHCKQTRNTLWSWRLHTRAFFLEGHLGKLHKWTHGTSPIDLPKWRVSAPEWYLSWSVCMCTLCNLCIYSIMMSIYLWSVIFDKCCSVSLFLSARPIRISCRTLPLPMTVEPESLSLRSLRTSANWHQLTVKHHRLKASCPKRFPWFPFTYQRYKQVRACTSSERRRNTFPMIHVVSDFTWADLDIRTAGNAPNSQNFACFLHGRGMG